MRVEEVEEYLDKFGKLSALPRSSLLSEMDRVWDELGLDNTNSLESQSTAVSNFYSHPIWILNGLFSRVDPVSLEHRRAIACFVASSQLTRVADYGGGSGVLASCICDEVKDAQVDVIEPYPFDYFVDQVSCEHRIQYRNALVDQYDAVIAQDVLEHVDEPIELAIRLIHGVRKDGIAIFANCFFPEIKCHLPSTFYLRHQFRWLLTWSGMEYLGSISGAEHAQIFRRTARFSPDRLRTLAKFGRRLGWLTNIISSALYPLKQLIKGRFPDLVEKLK